MFQYSIEHKVLESVTIICLIVSYKWSDFLASLILLLEFQLLYAIL